MPVAVDSTVKKRKKREPGQRLGIDRDPWSFDDSTVMVADHRMQTSMVCRALGMTKAQLLNAINNSRDEMIYAIFTGKIVGTK